MADWEGDWGFEPRVLEMVESSIAPYIIDYERNSPCPFVALQTISDGPSTAFELLQLETEYFCSSNLTSVLSWQCTYALIHTSLGVDSIPPLSSFSPVLNSSRDIGG
ncbi:hypothetical protein VDGE_30309 [Verticillium dahliae]|uniref:Uncharacterized protein n=1 Tax=Verticillium dahliae TaxID=27337 RepID=A0A444RWJ7_VERDA|nr:hypothetical protein VDGE_30309 [Verticillium dahliae]